MTISLYAMNPVAVCRMTRRERAKLTTRETLQRDLIIAMFELELRRGDITEWADVRAVERARQALADHDAGVTRYHSYPVGFFNG